jgi:hypothetical protein
MSIIIALKINFIADKKSINNLHKNFFSALLTIDGDRITSCGEKNNIFIFFGPFQFEIKGRSPGAIPNFSRPHSLCIIKMKRQERIKEPGRGAGMG